MAAKNANKILSYVYRWCSEYYIFNINSACPSIWITLLFCNQQTRNNCEMLAKTFNCNWEKVSEHKAPEGKDAHNKVHYAAHEHAANIICIFATLSAMRHIARISRYVDSF